MELPRVVSAPCREEDDFLLARAVRAYRSQGMPLAAPQPVRSTSELAAFLRQGRRSVLIVRPGAWPLAHSLGLPLPGPDHLLVGVAASGPDKLRWEQIQAACGGQLRALSRYQRWRGLPQPPVCLLGSRAAGRLAALLATGLPLLDALQRLAWKTEGTLAAIHPALRSGFDPALRILQAITSLQRGGAERVCLDQADWLSASGSVRCAVAVLGKPGRAEWAAPRHLIDLSTTPARPGARADALLGAADTWGADVAHVHLLSASTSLELKRRGLPVVVTLHNQAVAWPTGTSDLPAASQADLFLGCSRSIAAEMRARLGEYAPPIRALPNGVQHHPLSSWARHEARTALRAAWGCADDVIVLLAVANPRPQKRLEALPSIAATAARLDPRQRRFRVVIAGSPGQASPGAETAQEALVAARDAASPHSVILLGDVPQPARLMAAADALVCCSRHEGLSLSWLEALREGLPVASFAVGGAAEVAAQASVAFQLAAAGDDGALAAAVLRAVDSPRPSLPADYTIRAMANRSAALCRRVAARRYAVSRRQMSAGVWIVTYNLALGGAQSSARRLLETLHARGVPVRCAVVEEHAERPTLGARALAAAGVKVHHLVPGRPAEQAQCLLARMDADPPEAVLFWNLPPVLRVLLSDLLLGASRVIDVSPGEMSFRSLARFFSEPETRVGLPYPTARDYGQLLHAAVVKYAGEAELAAAVLGCSVAVIPNGVSLPQTPCPRPLARPHGPVIFGTAARLSPDKRLEELIAAFRLALPLLPRQSRLLIAGASDGSSSRYARSLRRACAGLPVAFLGRIASEDMHARFHAKLDVFVMVSRPAGCPNASLEAMAAGLPVVATDWGGAREQVVPGKTGLLTPDGDPASLAAAMVHLAEQPGTRREMAIAARQRARTVFSLEIMADDYLRLCLDGSNFHHAKGNRGRWHTTG